MGIGKRKIPSRLKARNGWEVLVSRSSNHSQPAALHGSTDPDDHGWARSLLEFVLVILVTLLVMVSVRHLVAQRFYVPSGSMEGTIMPGDYIMASKLVPQTFNVQRGDIVVFNDSHHWLGESVQSPAPNWATRTGIFLGVFPDSSHQQLVKRVIGLPGDTVRCCDANGRVQINGISVDEPYLKAGEVPSAFPFSVKVPEDRLWVMGDNRGNSADSRAHMNLPEGGYVPISDVIGKAVAVTWPLSRMQWFDEQRQVFRAVPSPSK